MAQNISHAVMAQRTEKPESLDNFPTPPWATRALMHHVLKKSDYRGKVCLEPACGQGHMAKVLWEYFEGVTSCDIHDYGYGVVTDFLSRKASAEQPDWIITNPPFKLAERFITKALDECSEGIAMLVRTTFIESVGRYKNLFQNNPPTYFAQFVERVPMVKGRLDKSASTATGYAWLVWKKNRKGKAELVWIPPCRKQLEYDGDYDAVQSSSPKQIQFKLVV